VLYRMRTCLDQKGHEECEGYGDRFHLIDCPRFTRDTPVKNTLFKDGSLMRWVDWIWKNDFLNMGTISTITEQLETRVVFGNPFEHMITIERNGVRVTELTPTSGWLN